MVTVYLSDDLRHERKPDGEQPRMITAMNRIHVVPEYAEQFEQRFRTRARLVDGMPGFIWNKVLRPVNPVDPYIVLTLWESRAAFDAWVKSDEFVKGHAQSGTLPQGASRPMRRHAAEPARVARGLHGLEPTGSGAGATWQASCLSRRLGWRALS